MCLVMNVRKIANAMKFPMFIFIKIFAVMNN